MSKRTHIYFDNDVWDILQKQKSKSYYVNNAIRHYYQNNQSLEKEKIKQLVLEILNSHNIQPQVKNDELEDSINNLFGGI